MPQSPRLSPDSPFVAPFPKGALSSNGKVRQAFEVPSVPPRGERVRPLRLLCGLLCGGGVRLRQWLRNRLFHRFLLRRLKRTPHRHKRRRNCRLAVLPHDLFKDVIGRMGIYLTVAKIRI